MLRNSALQWQSSAWEGNQLFTSSDGMEKWAFIVRTLRIIMDDKRKDRQGKKAQGFFSLLKQSEWKNGSLSTNYC
jgi:hypothetical protein